MTSDSKLILVNSIEPLILTIRGQRIILDYDLAALYGRATKSLNQAVKRNRERFPTDFMFQLTAEEKQEVVTNCDHLSKLKFAPRLPLAFTEHGAIMAAEFPASRRSQCLRGSCLVKLREFALTHKELARKLAELEQKVGAHDESIGLLVAAIRELMTPPTQPRRGRIGFGRQGES